MYQSITCLFSVICPSFEMSKNLLRYQGIHANFDRIRALSLSLAEACMKDRSKIQLAPNESLSGKPMAFGYINRSMIAYRLQEIFPNAEIILFLRGQQQMLLSYYNQWVKGYPGGFRTIDDFVWHPTQNYTYGDFTNHSKPSLNSLFWNTNKFYVNLECFKYFELISLYKKLFKKTHVFLYEDFIADKTQVLGRMEEILGEKIHLTPEKGEKRVNKSISQGALIKKLNTNRAELLGGNRYTRKVLGFLLNLGKTKYIDPQNYIQEVAQGVYEENNQQLIAAYPEIGLQCYPRNYII